MKGSWWSIAIIVVPLVTLGSSCPSESDTVEVEVWGNAAFDRSGERILQMAVVYDTPNAEAPYYNDPEARACCLRFRDSASDLETDARTFEIPDSSDSVDFGPLGAPMWWKPEENLVLFKGHEWVQIVGLATGEVAPLQIPPELVPDLFGGNADDERGLALDFAPSPDGRTVAVFYRLAVQDESNPLILHNYDAIAFFSFDASAAFLSATALTPWQGEDEPLRLDPPLPTEDPVDPGETPPITTERILVRAHYFLWADESQSVFVLDRADSAEDTNRVAMIEAASGMLHLLGPDDPIPGEPVATRGGGAREDGLALYVVETPDDPNGSHVTTQLIDGWPGFDGRGTILVSELDYGL